MNVKIGNKLDITFDRSISEKCIAEWNRFNDKYNITPNTLYLTSEDYLSLYLHTFFNWTRVLNKPHTLEKYQGCDIVVVYDTEKSPSMAYKTKK